jgi:hypothetical protein
MLNLPCKNSPINPTRSKKPSIQKAKKPPHLPRLTLHSTTSPSQFPSLPQIHPLPTSLNTALSTTKRRPINPPTLTLLVRLAFTAPTVRLQIIAQTQVPLASRTPLTSHLPLACARLPKAVDRRLMALFQIPPRTELATELASRDDAFILDVLHSAEFGGRRVSVPVFLGVVEAFADCYT